MGIINFSMCKKHKLSRDKERLFYGNSYTGKAKTSGEILAYIKRSTNRKIKQRPEMQMSMRTRCWEGEKELAL
jgi:hypothetical protein